MEDHFTNRKPATPEIEAALDAFTEEMKRAGEAVMHLVPAGRPRSIAFTKLEEVSMWGKKGIVFGPGGAGGAGGAR